jgi:hypothetical protein
MGGGGSKLVKRGNILPHKVPCAQKKIGIRQVMHEINKIVLMQQTLFSVCASSSMLRGFEMTASPWSKRDSLGPQCNSYN